MHASIALTARAAWKGPSFVVFPGMQEARKTGKPIRTMSRSSTIIPNFVGLKLQVWTGNAWQPLTVTDEMVGYKVGEFIRTMKPWHYKGEAEPPF